MTLKDTWNNQYNGDRVSALKDDNLFRMEVEAIVETCKQLINECPEKTTINILELGSGSGELIRQLEKNFISLEIEIKFVGVDFSENAVSLARESSSKNQQFFCSDFLSYLQSIGPCLFDLVVTQRSIMALMAREEQEGLLNEIYRILVPDGFGVFSECFQADLEVFNEMRTMSGLPAIDKVWHSRYLDEEMLSNVFDGVSYNHFCATYMLITRIIYPFFQDPVHNQKIHDLASLLPNSGSTSFLKLATVRKN